MNNPLKSISTNNHELRVGNYMVLFGGKDLTGEFFTEKTKFDSGYTEIGLMYVDFEHGRDAERAGNSKNNILGVVDWKSARFDEKGIFVERVLNRRAEYIKYLEELIDAGIVGTSSEAISGQVRKKSSGEIVEWPLMRDSLTVTPMEPRMITENILTAAKALSNIYQTSKSLAQIAGKEIEDPVIGLKAIEQIEDLRSVEQYLRDSGLSRREALAVISKVKSLSQSDSVDDMKEIREMVSRNTSILLNRG
jgi:hypothetical protein